jgi:paraquat-inducible protein B
MSKKASPTVIGGFVVGAVVLAVVAVALLGGGELFAKKYTFVAFFEGSLKGLNIGAPVTFRGVRLGTVSNIVIRYDSSDQSVRIPVYFDLEQGRVEAVRERARDPYESLQGLIDDGLRAQLVMQSFVTGQIAVQLDFHENTPAEYVGAEPDCFEFPTIPSTVEKMGRALEDFDLEGLLSDIRGAAKGIDELAQSPKLRDAIAALDETIRDFGKLARNVDAKVDPLATSIEDTLGTAGTTLSQATESIVSAEEALNETLRDIRKLVRNVDENVDPVVTSFENTANAAVASLEQAQATLAAAQHAIAEDSELYYNAVKMLEELSAASRAVRVLAEFLEQHPEALLQGKSAPGGK